MYWLGVRDMKSKAGETLPQAEGKTREQRF